MTDIPNPHATPGILKHRAVVSTFVATTFVGSTLLFLVQPMFAKMVLPRLGGSPAVWNTCVLFFQTTLLLGYLYAHFTVRWLGARRQALVHVLVIASAAVMLPLTLGDAVPTRGENPVLWLLMTLALRLGLPFFALSTMAPLAQRWFSTLPVPSASNPYLLYAASNTGSMLALLGYPFLLEPIWGTHTQTLVWAVGYGVLLVLAAVCALWVRRDGRDLPVLGDDGVTSWKQKVRWTALAFVPSSLMLGVTTHISTDLASIPLLWVLPLAAYLLTFVLVFSTREWIPRRFVARVLPVLVLGAILSTTFQSQALWLIPLHLAAFFVAALTCHDALARTRPPAQGLTTFYLWMSFGGVLGGVFNTLLAPVLFSGIYEYPIVLALACLARSSPAYRSERMESPGMFVATCVVPLLVAATLWAAGQAPPGVSFAAALLTAALVPAVVSAFANRCAPFNVIVFVWVVVLIVGLSARSPSGDVVFAGRSFFGVLRVVESADHSYRVLQHGTTIHGRQNLPAASSCEPKSYYDSAGPVGDLFRRSRLHFTDVAVVGLGTGSLVCYADPGSRWTVFEIDPLIERIARDPSLFTFIQNSPGRVEVSIGDGRMQIEAAAADSFDLIVLDAFSSDSVPIHLLTEEAIDAYLSRLRPEGIIALHISNRFLDLEPVVGRVAVQRRLASLTNQNLRVPWADIQNGRDPTQWVVLARAMQLLAPFEAIEGWRSLANTPAVRVWTDDYSNLLRSFRWR